MPYKYFNYQTTKAAFAVLTECVVLVLALHIAKVAKFSLKSLKITLWYIFKQSVIVAVPMQNYFYVVLYIHTLVKKLVFYLDSLCMH